MTRPSRNVDARADATTLWDLFAARVAAAPDAPAVRDGASVLTYAELAALATGVAAGLRRRGVERGSLVGISLERGAELVAAVLGVLQAGAAYVPLDPAYPTERLRMIVRDAAPAAVLTRGAAEAWVDTSGVATLCFEDVSQAAPAVQPPTLTADDLAYVIYTSGSTGVPKGVAVTHGCVAGLLAETRSLYDFGAGDRWTLFHSYAFDFSVWEIFGALTTGGELIVVPLETARDPDRFLELLLERPATVLNQTPSAFYGLLGAVDRRGLGPAALGLRYVIFGGEALDPARVRTWLEAPGAPALVNMYGITETTVHATFRALRVADASGDGDASPIGRPLPGRVAYVVDELLDPADGSGELVLGGVGLARGYLGRPGLTADRFVPDPFAADGTRLYRSGDRVLPVAGGELEFLGRLDDQVKIRGYRIEPGEVEATLRRHPDVADAAVVAREIDGVRRLIGYVTGPADPDAVRAFVGEQLPAFMVPSVIVRLDDLPLTANGKLDRDGLPSPATRASTHVAEAAQGTESVVGTIWAETLGIATVGSDDNFFDLGGDSISALHIVARCAERGLTLAVSDVFELQTLGAVAAAARLAPGPGTASHATVREPSRGQDVADAFPLAPLQEGLLFETELAAAPGAYLLQFTAELERELSADELRASCSRLVERHAALRTAIRWRGLGDPVQFVAAAAAIPVVELDWSEAGHDGSTDERLEALLADDRAVGFDLATPPLLRLHLIRIRPGRVILVLTGHHIVLDAWSMGILLDELFALHDAGAERDTVPLAAPGSYRDYVEWSRSGPTDDDRAFWRRELGGLAEVTRARSSRPLGPAAQARIRRRLPLRLEEAVFDLARTRRLTPNAVLQGAFALTLARWQRQDDVVFGSVVSVRPPAVAHVQRLVGLCIETIPVRALVEPAAKTDEWLRDLQTRQVEAQAHARLPLVELRAFTELPPSAPMFECLFAFDGYLIAESSVRAAETWTESRVPLAFVVSQTGGLEISAFFRTDAISQTEVERLCDWYVEILEQLLRDPGQRLGQLAIARGHAEARATPHGYVPPTELFRRCVETHPELAAVAYGDAEMSYAALDRQSDRIARQLRSRGVRTETVVALCLPPSSGFVAALLAVWKAGGAFLPLDVHDPPARLEELVALSGATVVVTDDATAELASRFAIPALSVDDVGDDVPVRLEHVESEVALAYVICTSGSTGAPIAVGVSRAGIAGLVRAQSEAFGIAPGVRVLQFASPAFDAAVAEIAATVLAGGTLVVPKGEHRLEASRAALERTRVDVVTVPPAFLAAAPQALAHVGTVVVAGEACPPRLAREWSSGRVLINAYGPTETTVCATLGRVEPTAVDDVVSIGVPLPGVTAHVVDLDLNSVADGIAGELVIGGPGVARGYVGKPALTAERFLPDPFGPPGSRLYRSGDLVQRRPEGGFDFLARLDRQVKVRGVRVESAEVERVLLELPGVVQAAVEARLDGDDSQLVAYYAGDAADGAVRAFVAERLPAAMVPRDIVRLAALPLTRNGKVDRAALPAPERRRGRPEYRSPRTRHEAVLAEVWAELLCVDRVGADDDFFELGGHSLLALRVVGRIEERLGAELDLGALFTAPRLSDLAARLEEQAGPPPVVPVAERDRLPLTFGQERLWFLDRLTPGSIEHNIVTALRLRGPLDRAALADALTAAVARHEALRTVIVDRAGRPQQVVLPPASRYELPALDLSHEADAETAARRACEAEAALPFDLAVGPLLRPSLLRLAEDDHVLVVAVHHAVCDGWSAAILVDELAALYRGEELDPPPLQYADFALWERDVIAEPRLDEQLAYWRGALEACPVLDLQTDRPRPAVRTSRAATAAFELPAGVAERIAALSAEHGVTRFMTLLTGFQLTLGCFAGQHDLTVGTPVAGRTRPELDGVVGFFVNTLVLRCDLAGDPTVAELLARTRDRALAAYAHQDVPFERVVEELNPQRDRSRTPLFQAALTVEETPRAPAATWTANLSVEPLDVEPQATGHDVHLFVVPRSDGTLAGRLVYATELFDHATAERLASLVAHVLEQIVDRPAARLSELSMLPAADIAAVLDGFNRVDAPVPPATVPDMFDAQAARTPGATAVVCGDDAVTYRELRRRVVALAARLGRRGIGPESIVGVLLERSIEQIVAVLAVLQAGAAYLPLDPDDPPARAAMLLEDAEASLVLSSAALAGRLPTTCPPTLRIDSGADAPAVGQAAGSARPANLAYVVYTSGTTGAPKGVAVSHFGIASLVHSQAASFGVGEGRRVLQFAAPSFDAAVAELFVTLLSGATLVLLPPGDRVERALAALADGAVDVATVPPALLAELETVGGVSTLVVAGETCPPDLARTWRAGRRLINAYGPTETTVCATLHEVDDGIRDRVPIGRPIANTRVYVVDPNGNPVPIGVAGELLVGGHGVARGYLGLAGLTAERFVPDRFAADGTRLYRTGDRVRWLVDGQLEFLGRLDDQVKVRGRRIEPAEIEAALRALPGIRVAVVGGQDDDAGGSRLVAWYVADEQLAPAALRASLAQRLPAWIIPDTFVELETLPLLPNGKIDRRALAATAVPRRRPARIEPLNPVEQLVRDIWRELLGVEEIGADDDFFQLGGQSLTATRFVARVREALEVELPVSALFDASTLAGVAERIAIACLQDETADDLVGSA